MTQHRIEVIDRIYAAILASKTPAERVTMAASASDRFTFRTVRNYSQRIRRLRENFKEIPPPAAQRQSHSARSGIALVRPAQTGRGIITKLG